MASQIMFSGIIGLILGEWKGTKSKTRTLLFADLAVLLVSAVVSGYSGKLGQEAAKAPAVTMAQPAP